MHKVNSRISGFYRLPLGARRDELLARVSLTPEDLAVLDSGGLAVGDADRLVENAIGLYALPLGLGLNFLINGRDYLVPMAVEEPSVIAAASNAARMVRSGGGFQAEADQPVMTAQVEIVGVPDMPATVELLRAHQQEILELASAAVPRLVARGGGPRSLDVRIAGGDGDTAVAPGALESRRVVVHVHVDCRDAMGANLVNTVAEAIAPRVAQLGGGRFGLRILTNLCDRRLVRVRARVPFSVLAPNDAVAAAAADIAADIAAASRFAEHDAYRAATHNKGIMNGVDAVVIASGNDWRGVEAGAHAFAARSGRYEPLATWQVEAAAPGQDAGDAGSGALIGQLEMPMAVGTVGGTLQVHAGARLAQRILGVESASALGMVAACVGLASNLAALRALATEGIQRGHMALHNRAIGRAPNPVDPVDPVDPPETVATPAVAGVRK
jgi:hydroxymethylglutaryl-CoA reductase